MKMYELDFHKISGIMKNNLLEKDQVFDDGIIVELPLLKERIFKNEIFR